MKYLVKIRKSFGEISDDAKLVDGKIYNFIPFWYIDGGNVSGEVKMSPCDDSYPENGPEFLALGDLEFVSVK